MMEEDFKKRVEDFESQKELPGAPETPSLPPYDEDTEAAAPAAKPRKPRTAKPKAARAAGAAAATAAGLVGAETQAATADIDEVQAVSGISKGSMWILALLIGLAACGLLYYAGMSARHHNEMKQLAQTEQSNAGNLATAAYYNQGAMAAGAIPTYDQYATVDDNGYIIESYADPYGEIIEEEDYVLVPVTGTTAAQRYATQPPVTARAAAKAAPAQNGSVYVYYFGNNAYQIPENATLNDLASIARRTGKDIVIKAYASPTGSEAYNQQLSNRRARAIGRYLRDRGVKPANIKATGYGETDAYATPAQDRRAVITLE